MSDSFEYLREEMEQLGIIYRKIELNYGDEMSVNYMDPRNHFSIVGYLFRQWKSGSVNFKEFMKSLFFGVRRGAFFYNGHWINPDKTLNPDDILQAIENYRKGGSI